MLLRPSLPIISSLFRLFQLDLTYSQLETLYSLVSIHSIGQPKSAFDMLYSSEKGNTFCLDQAFPMTKMNRGINEVIFTREVKTRLSSKAMGRRRILTAILDHGV